MNTHQPQQRRKSTVWLVAIMGTASLMLLTLLLPRTVDHGRRRPNGEMSVIYHEDMSANRTRSVSPPMARPKPAATPEETVAEKVSQFGRSRREITYGLARKHGVEVSAEVERFFDAVQAGNWEQIEALFTSLQRQHQRKPSVQEVDAVWPAILDAFGAAEAGHDWPAKKLLEYGNAIMGTLRPDMVYVGGTDPGRWIPALMNTSEGEQHIVITQNGLADSKYLEYVQFLYGDRFGALDPEEATAAQKEYLRDARKRLEHDQQFPDEPRQVRPGEDVRITTEKLQQGFADGDIQAAGQTSIMAVNEILLNKLLQKNPDLSFALEESFPMKSVNAEASPIGPIMELRAEGENALTQERAAQAVEYWRDETKRLMADPEFKDSDYAKKSYSKLVSSQGGVLVQHGFLAEAEEAFRYANELCPYSPEAVFRYVSLLVDQNRIDEAARVVSDASKSDPKSDQFRDLAAQLGKRKTSY